LIITAFDISLQGLKKTCFLQGWYLMRVGACSIDAPVENAVAHLFLSNSSAIDKERRTDKIMKPFLFQTALISFHPQSFAI